MSRLIAIVFMFSLVASSLAGAEESPRKESLDGDAQKMSYALGADIGGNLSNLPIEIDLDVFLQGIRDTVSGKDLLLSPEEIMATKRDLAMKVQAERTKQRDAQSEENKQAGEAFLAANKEKEGVVTTESGLQYKIMTAGDGPIPKADDKVTVHYRGTLIDGTEFDSSFTRGKPATFPLNGVIKGWTEALQLMPVGSKWQLVIPPDLAYGDRGAGQKIGPNSTLIFEVELISIGE